MKKVIPLLALMLLSCEPDHVTGYIVFKKHIGKHMCCDDNVKCTTEAGMIVVPHPVIHQHHHEEKAPTWTLYIGNSYGTTQVNVTENCYNYFKVTDKVIYDYRGVHLIKKGCRYGNN